MRERARTGQQQAEAIADLRRRSAVALLVCRQDSMR